MNTVKNPTIPCEIPIPGGVSLGTMITVQGTVPQTSDRFAVNLLCNTGDIALHVGPKFRENYVARNNVSHMTWGKEERSGGLPIYPGQSFEIIILCEEDDFKIAFNGNHFTEFNHRVPFSKISSVEVEGDVIVNNIHFGGESGSVSDKSNPSSASYGFQPRAPSPYVNSGGDSSTSGGGMYPTIPQEPSYPTPGPFPSAPNPSGPYPSIPPQRHSPSPGPFPSAPSGGLYPSAPGQQPNYPPPGPYPATPNSAGGFYPGPTPSGPYPGPYPSSGPQYPPQGPSLYPQQPGYGPGPHQGTYPQMPNQNSQGYSNSKSGSKNNFLNQAGMAIAGILGPALLSKGLRKAQGQGTGQGQDRGQGRPDILGQAAGTLAGLLGGAGLSGLNRGQGVVPPHSQSSHMRPGGSILDQAGSALAGIFGGRSGLMGNASHKHGVLGGALGSAVAGAALTGHLNPIKVAKKQAKAQKKALKYGLPIAGAGLGAYALHKGLKKGFRRSSSSSSSSSSD